MEVLTMTVKEEVTAAKKNTAKAWKDIAVGKIVGLLDIMLGKGFFTPIEIKMPHYENVSQLEAFKEKMDEFGLRVQCIDKKHWLEIIIY